MVGNTKLLETFRSGNFEKLELLLLDNIREETAKEKGNKSQLTIIKNFVKKSEERFKKYSDYNGKCAFVDGFRILISDDSFGYEKMENGFKIDTMIPDHFDSELTFDVASVKYQIEINKSLGKYNTKPVIVYDSKNDLYCGFNPNYILDLINFTGQTTFKYNPTRSRHFNSLTAPIYSFDENGELLGVVLPINIKGVPLDDSNVVCINN